MAAAERLRVAIAETGLAFDRLNPPASSDKSLPLGGPFVPVQVAPESSPFTHAFSKVQEAVLATDRLRRIVPYVPLRKPLPAPDVTPGFGVRIDPFLGRPAMHTGIDLRDDYGALVRATAAGVSLRPNGRAATAGWSRSTTATASPRARGISPALPCRMGRQWMLGPCSAASDRPGAPPARTSIMR